MAMVVTESEGCQKRHYTCMKDGEIPQAKSTKRRRRDSNASVVRNSELIQQQRCYSTSAPKTVKRSSRFRGVSRHKWTGRYEAHLWDKLTWNVTQKKKGKQVYLGAYDDEEAAARAYDLAALKYWGTSTFTNFPISEHEKEIEIMQTTTRQEYLATLRSRKSSGFSRGTSMYRAAPRHHQNGKWEDRIGSIFGNKSLYLSTCSTQEEAARAYGMPSIEYSGINAITNFDLTTNITWLNSGKNNSVPVQERRFSRESEEALTSLCSGIKLHYTCLPAKSCRINAMNTQENYDRSVSFNSCRRSSCPTALDLLLRSSVFKELVEKNSNMSEKENNEDNAKNLQHGMYSHIPLSYNSNND